MRILPRPFLGWRPVRTRAIGNDYVRGGKKRNDSTEWQRSVRQRLKRNGTAERTERVCRTECKAAAARPVGRSVGRRHDERRFGGSGQYDDWRHTAGVYTSRAAAPLLGGSDVTAVSRRRTRCAHARAHTHTHTSPASGISLLLPRTPWWGLAGTVLVAA